MKDKQARTAALLSIAILHVWGSMIVWRVTFGEPIGDTTGRIFEAICFGIFMTLAVVAGDKGIQALIEARFGVGRIEETTTKTVHTTAESTGENAIQIQPKVD